MTDVVINNLTGESEISENNNLLLSFENVLEIIISKKILLLNKYINDEKYNPRLNAINIQRVKFVRDEINNCSLIIIVKFLGVIKLFHIFSLKYLSLLNKEIKIIIISNPVIIKI